MAATDFRTVSATFAFGTTEGNVGVPLPSQLIVTSCAHKDSAPILISEIKIAFEGGLKNLNVHHKSTEKPEASTPDGLGHLHILLQKASADMQSLTSSSKLPQGSQPLVGVADLEIAAGVTKAMSFDQIPRDPGDVEVASITLCMSEADFDMELVITDQEQIHQENLWVGSSLGLLSKTAQLGRGSVVKILPKPPRMQIEAYSVLTSYFTDEDISIPIGITNEEEEETNVSVDARLLAPSGILPRLTWALNAEENSGDVATEDPLESSRLNSTSMSIGNLAPMVNQKRTLCIQGSPIAADYTLEINARYHVLSDPETLIVKSLSIKVTVEMPFDANHSFLPMIDSEPWPSYFSTDDPDQDFNGTSEQKIATGLTQRWYLTSRVASLANVPLMIESVELQVVEIHEGAICSTSARSGDTVAASMISPNDLQAYDFVIRAQKLDLEDRRSTFLDLRVEVKWHRDGFQGHPSFTRLSVPELVMPFGEPRVLASAQNATAPPGAICLDYVIENPSMYMLPFLLTMDTSEEFAFSGPKNVTVHLVPLSRHNIHYTILPFVKGTWISPQLRVFDTHFQKSLKVNATEGMRSDKKGVSFWVDVDS